MLGVDMYFMTAYATKRMGVKYTKCCLGGGYVHATVCVCTLGYGGRHGRGREFLGTMPLTVKHFRGCPSQT